MCLFVILLSWMRYEKTDKYLYNQLRNQSGRSIEKRRTVTLTFEQFCDLRKKPCRYCKGSLPERGTGVDRWDNDLDYTFENSVPCCTACNIEKGANIKGHEMDLISKLRKLTKKEVSEVIEIVDRY